MKKWVFLILLLCIMIRPVLAEERPEEVQALIPDEAAVEGEQRVGSFHVLTLSLDSGEVLELTWDERAGTPLSLITRTPAAVSGEPTSREAAEALVDRIYPGMDVLFSRDGENGAKELCLLAGNLCGEIVVAGNGVISRELTCGEYTRDGRLTMEGALAVLELHRPEAEFRALELDEDDGQLYYEGDAWLDGVEYEFELDARTGRLVEWERD